MFLSFNVGIDCKHEYILCTSQRPGIMTTMKHEFQHYA